jgi:signal transduction histidine kinase
MQWLLVIESLQSTGSRDPWRICREDIERFARSTAYQPLQGSSRTLSRLRAWQLLDEDRDGDRLTATGRAILGELVPAGQSPFEHYARALLEDRKNQLTRALGASPEPTSSEAMTRYVRMMTHELRNALVPVQIALEDLWQERGAAGGEDLGGLRATIDRGIHRVFQFVNTMSRTATYAGTPKEPFSLPAPIEDAVLELNAGPGTIVETRYESEPVVAGYRSRFVLAMLNILRNAVQVAERDVRIVIHLTTNAEGDRAILTIDDDGPGVSAERRQSIFQNGVSYRAGGGGEGLALARDVIENEMSGALSCDESPLGGARFTIELPVYQGSVSGSAQE